MMRLNRRRFIALSSLGAAGAALTACGGDKTTSTDLQPTKITDVAGAPTLADMATPPDVSAGAGAGGASAGAPATTVKLTAVDLKFEPADFTIAADTDVTIDFANAGALTHNFYMPKPEFTSKELTGGQAETFKLNLPAGTYDYWCPVPGHKEAGMVGKITVGGAAAAPAAAPAGAPAATTVALSAVDLKFEPADFTIAADTDVTVDLKNNGALPHNFYLDKTKYTSKVLQGGESESFKLNLPAGTYDYWCPQPGHKEAGMVGKITVGAAPAAPATGPASPAAGSTPAASPAAGSSPAASPVSSPAASPAAGAAGGSAAATTVDLSAVDLKFEPADFTIAAGTDVTINLKNNGVLQHNFYLDKTKYTSKVLQGGESESFKLNLPAGTYDYWCPEPGHKEAGMVGKITVA